MSLDYNLTNVRDYEELTDSDIEWNITQALIFHTMAVGLGSITEENWTEFYARVNMVESHDRPTLTVPKLVEFDPSVLMPPEGTTYIVVDGKWYYYDGFDPDTGALLLAEYEHPEHSMGPRRGSTVTHTVDSDHTYAYHDGFEPRPITPADVHRRIGLSTNVSNETRAKWTKRMTEYWLDNAKRKAERALATQA